MFRVLFLGSLLCMASVLAVGQINDDDAIFGGGFVLGWLTLPTVSQLNEVLVGQGYAALPDALMTFGGGGYGGELHGLRLGGRGGNGEASAVLGEKAAKLEIGFGGLMMEYSLFATETADVSAGVMLGGGEATLSLRAHQPATFEDAVASPTNTVLTRGFFLVQPHLSVEVLLGFIKARVYGAYLLTFAEPWMQRAYELPGAPANFNGWSVELLLTFGMAFPADEAKSVPADDEK